MTMQTNHELLTDAREFLRNQVVGAVPDQEIAESWDEFFVVYDTVVRRFARACGVRSVDVDECVQEVWLAIVSHLEQFEIDPERGRFRTWLYQVVRSKATDIMRMRGRGPGVSLDDSRQDIDVPSHPEDDAEKRLERLWKRETLRILLADLKSRVTEDSFRVFEKHALRGVSYDELAAEYSSTPQAIRTRYHRTLAQFRAMCDRYAFDDVQS